VAYLFEDGWWSALGKNKIVAASRTHPQASEEPPINGLLPSAATM
jgi:hypothetical protein